MAYYNEFPHTRNYDSDLGFLIRRYKELIEKVDSLSEEILRQRKDYTDAQLANYQRQINALINQIEADFTAFVSTVNNTMDIMRREIAASQTYIDAKIAGVNSRTDLMFEQYDAQIKEYIAEQVIEVKVLNYFTGEYVTVQDMLNYLSQFHLDDAISVNDLIAANNTYNTLIAYGMTYTDLAVNGGNIIQP